MVRVADHAALVRGHVEPGASSARSRGSARSRSRWPGAWPSTRSSACWSPTGSTSPGSPTPAGRSRPRSGGHSSNGTRSASSPGATAVTASRSTTWFRSPKGARRAWRTWSGSATGTTTSRRTTGTGSSGPTATAARRLGGGSLPATIHRAVAAHRSCDPAEGRVSSGLVVSVERIGSGASGGPGGPVLPLPERCPRAGGREVTGTLLALRVAPVIGCGQSWSSPRACRPGGSIRRAVLRSVQSDSARKASSRSGFPVRRAASHLLRPRARPSPGPALDLDPDQLAFDNDRLDRPGRRPPLTRGEPHPE